MSPASRISCGGWGSAAPRPPELPCRAIPLPLHGERTLRDRSAPHVPGAQGGLPVVSPPQPGELGHRVMVVGHGARHGVPAAAPFLEGGAARVRTAILCRARERRAGFVGLGTVATWIEDE